MLLDLFPRFPIVNLLFRFLNFPQHYISYLFVSTVSDNQPSGTGVQPPPNQQGQMPPFPIYVIPYPLPIVPVPSSCPCYLMNPGNNGTDNGGSSQSQGQPDQQYQQQGYAPYGIIGFVPIVFIPYCPGYGNNMQSMQNFPNAVPVQYNCGQCQANNAYRGYARFNGGRSRALSDLKEITSLAELDHLLINEIRPMKKSLRKIAAHPRILDKSKMPEVTQS